MRQFLSLGGGVQSTTLLLMSLHGEIENPCEAAIFSDPEWERKSTYENIEWLTEYAAEFNVPVYKIQPGNIKEQALSADKTEVSIPFFVKTTSKKSAMLSRQCTNKYKIQPTHKKIKELTGCDHKNPVNNWIGFSFDEISRMGSNNSKTFIKRYPLIEKRIRSQDCHTWLNKNGFKIPEKSSCIGCPMRSNPSWRLLSDTEIEEVRQFEVDIQAKGIGYRSPNHKPINTINNSYHCFKTHNSKHSQQSNTTITHPTYTQPVNLSIQDPSIKEKGNRNLCSKTKNALAGVLHEQNKIQENNADILTSLNHNTL